MAYAMTNPSTPTLERALQNERIARLIVARFEAPSQPVEPEVRQAPPPRRPSPRLKRPAATPRKARRPDRRPPARPPAPRPEATPAPTSAIPEPVVVTSLAPEGTPAERPVLAEAVVQAEAPEGPGEVPTVHDIPVAEAPPSVASAEYEPGPDVEGLRVAYLGKLNAFFRRAHRYPRRARRAGLEGTVLLELVLDAAGRILSIRVAESSGHSLLDDAAKAAVAHLQTVPRPPGELAREAPTVRNPFHYNLRG